MFRSRLPFELEVSFNLPERTGSNNRGFCLHYRQLFC